MPHDTLSGPELSVEVARRVMGWDKAGIVNGRCYIPCQGYWEPHESIETAWEVVAYVHLRFSVWNGWERDGEIVGDRIPIRLAWYAYFGDAGNAVAGETAPLAIVRAALKAVEGK